MSEQTTPPTLIVGVGASAGGLEAFRVLLSVLPSDSGMAFLLVQHLDPTHKSMLTELLAPRSEMVVTEADQGIQLRADTVYIIRPDTALAVRQDKIELSTPTLHRGVRLPVDHLFRSLAQEYGPRAVGIVLSGAGSDGSVGIRDIKASGGLTIAQAPESCGQPGMAQSAIDTGVVDLVLEIDEIPAALGRFASLPSRVHVEHNEELDEPPERVSSLDDEEFGRLAALFEAHSGFDLRIYKRGTIGRRVLRRMTLSGIDEVAEYLDRLREDPGEQQTLVRDLLISVTDFFRDPQAFATLRAKVIDPLVAQAGAGATLRAWVPGCATGEEAYSIGMEFLEAFDAHRKRLSLQIFATDVDQDALVFARAATYPTSIAEHVSAQRLETHFRTLDGRGYQVRPPLRDVVSFAVHDLTKDPPFSRMNLVSCRNVLIYLTAEAQEHVLKILHFALEPGGHLLLSTSESPGPQRELFSTVSKPQRIYRKIGASRPIMVSRSRSRLSREATEDSGASPGQTRRPGSGELARRSVMAALVAPTVVISEDGAVLFAHGELGPYLRIPQGESPRLELGALLRPEISTRTRGALYKCRRDQEPVVVLSSPDVAEGARVRITARPAPELGAGSVILSFETLEQDPSHGRPGAQPEDPEQEAIIEQLEQELQATREDLRNTVEELETSNEELRSSNEESMSVNEELQSANEELEATTEELRSLNEELTTVNAQLREKVEQLEHAHDDLQNFFASTKIATIFLDERCCIKRFTPTAREMLSIDHADTGRFVGDIARELLQGDLQREAKAVLEHLAARSCELHTSDGRWISRQVLPYRTESRRIEGVVVTFVDITELKSATEQLAIREQQQRVIARLGLHALREAGLQDFMDQTVREVQQTLKTDLCKILELQPGGKRLLLRAGLGWRPGLVGSTCVPSGPSSQAGYTIQSDEPVIVEDLAAERRFSGPALLVEHDVVSGLSSAIRDGDRCYGVIAVHTTKRYSFTREDANFLQAVASIVSSAIGRYQSRTRLAMELGVAHVLTGASGLEDAMPPVLECMTSEIEGKVAEVWWLDDDGDGLGRRYLHVAPGEDQSSVRERLGPSVFEPGDGFVGRVFEQRRAIWCSDLGEPAVLLEHESAEELGLVSGVGIPVCAGTEVLGVITILCSERLFADDGFLRSLEAIGRAIGSFVLHSELEQRARHLAAITESSHDAILSYESDGTVTEWLAGAERLFGYTAQEMIGSSIERIVPEDEREVLWAINERIRRREVVEPFEATRRCKNGTLVEVSVRSSPVEDREGAVVGISSTDRDISRQKLVERRLVTADRQKDEFLAMLGHELRNPLAAIRSAAELMKDNTGGEPVLVKMQSILERQTAHMAKLLDGLLDVSRIIRGKISLERDVVDFAALCREVISDAIDRLGPRRLDIRTQVPLEPVLVQGDPVRLTQLVDNLLSNAVKYTGDGGAITISLECEHGVVELVVRDTGVGIEPDLLPHIFEVFRQSRQSLDRAEGGLGLGLALVKSLTELHDGSIEARSEGKGQGAEFVVRLPITKMMQARRPRAARAEGESLRILLIEDNEDAAEMLRRVLEFRGYRVTWVDRGTEGVAKAKELVPDIVLCDLGLPEGTSGFDVARALRSDETTRDVRLVAVSGYGSPENKTRGAEAGFDAHLTKPVDTEAIERVIESLGLRRPSAS